ncbi:MAG: ATP-binding protein [Candidatus Hodarchaeota archaeon]
MSDLGDIIGSFVSGSFVKLLIRQKANQDFELGQLFVAGNNENDFCIYQIKDLQYGSQIPDTSLELMAGYGLERPAVDFKIYEPELRNYVLATARPLIFVQDNKLYLPKKLPSFLADAFEIEDTHLEFFKEEKIDNPMNLGKIRSGSKILETEVKLEATEVLKHHILIPATTGRGKSNLVKTILYKLMENLNCGKLVFDPHNEYYGSLSQKGLRDHPNSHEFLDFYSIRRIPGALDLRFNVNLILPRHILSSMNFTQAQREALQGFYREHRENWLQAIFSNDEETYPRPMGLQEITLDVLRRRLSLLLRFSFDENDEIMENGIYVLDGSELTVHHIINALKNGKTVVVDTSLFEGAEEIFVATIIVENIFNEYKRLKFKDELEDQPVITIVLEEAPRVIGKKVLETRENVFGKIAREGRKFKIGLIGITQLPSLIEREILANMNTKIILGNEMGPERRTLIESSAQDLSDDNQTIGSLDIGEAIVTSNFTKFAIPIKIPLFEDLINGDKKAENEKHKIKRGSPGF